MHSSSCVLPEEDSDKILQSAQQEQLNVLCKKLTKRRYVWYEQIGVFVHYWQPS